MTSSEKNPFLNACLLSGQVVIHLTTYVTVKTFHYYLCIYVKCFSIVQIGPKGNLLDIHVSSRQTKHVNCSVHMYVCTDITEMCLVE